MQLQRGRKAGPILSDPGHKGGASAPSTPELEGGPRGKVGGFEEPVGSQPAARAAGDSGAQEDRRVLAGGGG